MIDAAVELSAVTKQFAHFTLDQIDLTLPTGCIMGFIGANGAGKSTTLRILMGLVHQDAGLDTRCQRTRRRRSGRSGLCRRTCGSMAAQP